jgi:hypothetical protein
VTILQHATVSKASAPYLNPNDDNPLAVTRICYRKFAVKADYPLPFEFGRFPSRNRSFYKYELRTSPAASEDQDAANEAERCHEQL